MLSVPHIFTQLSQRNNSDLGKNPRDKPGDF
jgi:hypothetical protein